MDTSLISSPVQADRQHLQQAFAVFNQASEQLAGAYQGLQDQVGRLTGELAVANGDLLRMQDELRRNQRLSEMGEMAARLAHQLRTPLAAALLYTANLTHAGLDGELRAQFAEKALSRLRHLECLIADMLLFVKGKASVVETLAVCDLLLELRQVVEPQMARGGLRFRMIDNSAAASASADRKALSSALLSLLENAMQASPRGGSITLTCDVDNDALVFRVRDEGAGIPAAVQARLFEPFFTTRDEGTGLGLAIVRGVVQSLGGSIEVVSAAGAGSEFIMRVPCTRTAPESILLSKGDDR